MHLILLSLFMTMGTSLVLMQNAVRLRIVDLPEERKVHLSPTPRSGGLAIGLGLLLSWLLLSAFTNHWRPGVPWQTLAAGIGFTLVGAMDDRFAFSPRSKLPWFVGLALLAAWPWAFPLDATGYCFRLGEFNFIISRIIAYIILSFWFLALPNGMNIEDAINGYMGGFTLIALCFAAWHGVNLALPIGALIGFLVFNWPTGRHFLGDAGSFGCGFLVAESLLRAGGGTNPMIPLILTAPISLDVVTGMIRRHRLGISFFEPDRYTLPHRVLFLLKSHPTLPSPILWANFVLAILSTFHQLLACIYISTLLGSIIWLNRAPLFRKTAE